MIQPILKDDSDGFSHSSQSVSNEGGTNDESSSSYKSNSESQPELARNETKLVRRSKALVLIVLLAAAAACGAGTYIFIFRGEEAVYRTQVSQNDIQSVA
jgi:uncharacterized protein HemX